MHRTLLPDYAPHMSARIRHVAFAVFGAIIALLVPTSAFAYNSAPLTFCNKNSADVGLAAGYHSPGISDPSDHSILSGPFVSQGWWEVAPGQCKTIENPFNARYMFWFAIGPVNSDYTAVIAMRDQNLPDHFCITSYFDGGSEVKQFVFEDENASANSCDQAGGAPNADGARHTLWINPHIVDTWVNATVNFTGQ